jgi:hypothetical protein
MMWILTPENCQIRCKANFDMICSNLSKKGNLRFSDRRDRNFQYELPIRGGFIVNVTASEVASFK